jgi:hypothetical protein
MIQLQGSFEISPQSARMDRIDYAIFISLAMLFHREIEGMSATLTLMDGNWFVCLRSATGYREDVWC